MTQPATFSTLPLSPQAGSTVLRLHKLALGMALLGPLCLLHPQLTNAAQPATQVVQGYQIPAGPLGSVLSQFASRAGVVLSFSSELTQGQQSTGLSGQYSVESGFVAILAETELRAVKRTSGDYVLEAKTASAVELSTVEVVGQSRSNSGYVATTTDVANKLEMPLIETAKSISIVTEAQIQDRAPVSVEQAVAYTAGVQVEGSGLDPRFDQIKVRGYAVTTNGDFLNGLRQPNTGWLSYYTTAPYNLERIEVVKGPDSVLFGQLTPGGLVNRVSKRPSDTPHNEVQFQLGSHDHVQGQFDLGGAFSEDVKYRLVGVARDAQTDIEQLDNDVTLLAPTLSWKVSDQTDITFISQYQERLTAGSSRPYQSGDELTHFWAGDAEFDKLDQQQWAVGYELSHRFNDRLELTQNARYGQVDTTNQYLSAGTLTGTTLSRSTYGVYEEMESLNLDTRLTASIDQGAVSHKLMVGLDYLDLDHEVIYASGSAPSIEIDNPDYRQPISKPDNILIADEGDTTQTGLYLRDQIAYQDWRFTAGLRRDWVRDHTTKKDGSTVQKKDAKTTSQLGALYLWNDELSTYLSYAQSFQPQTGTSQAGNDFEPTEGEQIEAGVKFQPEGQDALFTAAVYHLTESNRTTADPTNNLYKVQTGEVTTTGFELEAVGDLTDYLRLTASYNYNHAKITGDNEGNEGHTLANTPKHLASVWVDYTVPGLPQLGLAAGARYIGSDFTSNDNLKKNDDYGIVDLATHYDFSGGAEGVRLSLNANNVFDQEHITCQGSYCYRGAGRSVIASIAYRW